MASSYDPREETWNALTHGFGALLSVVGAAVLVTLAAQRGTPTQLVAAIVFGVALVLLYTASTLYHAVPHPAAKGWLKVFDHCAIYLLIAGSYTPFMLIGLRGHGGGWLLATVWTLAALGVVFKPLFTALSGTTLAWLFAGGAAYSLGTVFYLSRRAYAHAVWHGFVLAGSGCHFVAVALQVLGPGS